jgi:hypothetical protein
MKLWYFSIGGMFEVFQRPLIKTDLFFSFIFI